MKSEIFVGLLDMTVEEIHEKLMSLEKDVGALSEIISSLQEDLDIKDRQLKDKDNEIMFLKTHIFNTSIIR